MRFDDFRHAFAADTLCARHGRFPLAGATLQPGLRYAHDERGYIAYARSSKLDHRSVLVLGDPVCAAEDAAALLDDFLDRYPGSLFVAVGESTATALAAEHALRRVRLGAEIGIDPAAFAIAAGAGTDLDRAHTRVDAADGLGTTSASTPLTRRATDAIGRVEELSPEEASALRPLGDAWLLSRKGAVPERRFVTRPLGAPEHHQRWFALHSGEGAPEYLAVFDACRDEGVVSGYRAAIGRGAPHASPFAGRIVLEHVANALAKEGCRALWLGMAPPLATESGADEHLFLGLLRGLVGTLAAEASDQPPYAPHEVPDDVTRSPVHLVGRNGWGIEYVSALRDVSNLAA